MTVLEIRNKEDLGQLLERYGWQKSAVLKDLYCKESLYVETFSKDYFTVGLGDTLRCSMNYADIRVLDENMDPTTFGKYATVEANGAVFRLEE